MLTLALNAGGQLYCPVALTLEKHWTRGLVGPRAVVDMVVMRKVLVPTEN